MVDHITSKKTTYFKHFKFSFGAGVILLLAAIASMIHALIPNLFTGYSEQKIIALARLAGRRKKTHV